MIKIIAHDVLLQSFDARTGGSSGNDKARISVGVTFGILEAVWLVSKRQDLQAVMEHVETPTPKNLRHAGTEEVTLKPRLAKPASCQA
jgi:hypothetical protein